MTVPFASLVGSATFRKDMMAAHTTPFQPGPDSHIVHFLISRTVLHRIKHLPSPLTFALCRRLDLETSLD